MFFFLLNQTKRSAIVNCYSATVEVYAWGKKGSLVQLCDGSNVTGIEWPYCAYIVAHHCAVTNRFIWKTVGDSDNGCRLWYVSRQLPTSRVRVSHRRPTFMWSIPSYAHADTYNGDMCMKRTVGRKRTERDTTHMYPWRVHHTDNYVL